jgi:hypothetical protein
MATRDIRTFHETLACDVCGRTLLRGERAETWLAGGTRRQVCELCTPRALHEGWVREGARLEMASRAPAGERRRSLLGRLRQRLDRVDEGAERGVEPGGDGPPSVPSPAAVPMPPREPRQVRAIPTDPDHRVHAALEVFNTSEQTRTVAGVARSLGAPAVSVRAVPGTSRVAIAVSWELSWYRFEIELADDNPGASRVAQGYELGDLSPEELVPNAAADEYGRLALTAAGSSSIDGR